MLSFQRMDVYVCSIEFLAVVVELSDEVPRGHAALLDQLRRAATSIPLNIAEAAGRTGPADAARHYAIARGSAMECAAILDVSRLLKIINEATHSNGSALLTRLVEMLTRLCR